MRFEYALKLTGAQVLTPTSWLIWGVVKDWIFIALDLGGPRKTFRTLFNFGTPSYGSLTLSTMRECILHNTILGEILDSFDSPPVCIWYIWKLIVRFFDENHYCSSQPSSTHWLSSLTVCQSCINNISSLSPVFSSPAIPPSTSVNPITFVTLSLLSSPSPLSPHHPSDSDTPFRFSANCCHIIIIPIVEAAVC